MRIGIASTFPPYRGALRSSTTPWRALTQAGHEVQCATWSRQYPAFLFPGKTQFEPGKSIADASMPATLDGISPISWKRVGQDFGRRHNVDLLLLPFGTQRWHLHWLLWPPKPNGTVSDKWSPSCTTPILTTAKRGKLR